jgi:uncharacterized protein
VKITYDPVKRTKNLAKHGLDLADAAKVFEGEYSNARSDYVGEKRFIAVGYLDKRLVVVVWTQGRKTRRIISMRYCHAKEAKRWQARFG